MDSRRTGSDVVHGVGVGVGVGPRRASVKTMRGGGRRYQHCGTVLNGRRMGNSGVSVAEESTEFKNSLWVKAFC